MGHQSMKIYEKELNLNIKTSDSLIECFDKTVKCHLTENHLPIRFVVTQSNKSNYQCEIGIADFGAADSSNLPSIFEFNKRTIESSVEFNAVFLVPTGIGAEIGGHAGDATPTAKLLGSVCDKLITHPNVVNASDINEMPENTLYVEGSVLTRLLMGTIGLSEVRSNRVLAVIERHHDDLFTNAAINAVNAARSSYGLNCPKIVHLEPELSLTSEYSTSGRAVGRIENIDPLCEVLEKHKGEYDAIALASIVKVPREFHTMYFKSKGEMINAWGGPEAIFTHTLSSIFNVPTAHSPMLEDQLIANFDPGVVDPRMAAEAVSLTFLQCILKGLHKAPKIITDKGLMNHHSVYTVEDIACLVIPDGVLGLPTLAALEQGIKVIAVRENKNLMKNDLTKLPWQDDQFIQVDNYLEALGVMTAIKEGLSIESIRRPIVALNTKDNSENSVKESISLAVKQ